jgi:DNA-binding beta-propeller fold protein YncE
MWRLVRAITLLSGLFLISGLLVDGSAAGVNPYASVRRLWVDDVLGSAVIHHLVVSPDETRVYVTGVTTDQAYETIAYDARTGTRLWTAIHPTGQLGGEYPVGIAVSVDGSRLFVAGAGDTSNHRSYTTIAYDAVGGGELWVAQYGSTFAHAMALSPDGTRVFVTGAQKPATVAYDAVTGTQLWTAGYSGDSTVDLAVAPDGSRVYVTGQKGSPDSKFETDAYDAATGLPLWKVQYQDPSHLGDVTTGIAVSPDGAHVYVIGCQRSGYCFDDGTDFATVAYESETGTQDWVATFDGPLHLADRPSAIEVSPDSSLVFVGGSAWPEPFAGSTVAYHAIDGSQAWARGFPAPENGNGTQLLDLAVSRDGSRLVVTGGSIDPGSGEFVGITVGYGPAEGSQLWVARDPTRYFEAVGMTHDGRATFLTGIAGGGEIWTSTAYRSP